MSRVLYVATSDIHIRAFHEPYLDWLSSEGHVVDIAAENRGGIRFKAVNCSYWLPMPRTPWTKEALRTLRRLKRIIADGEYDLIHCHTPVASALTRLASRHFRKEGGTVVYTAHGFHFSKGGPWRHWLIYYPAEWVLSSLTDAIIVINSEDFSFIEGKMRHRRSFKIPGIGVRSDRFKPISSDRIPRQRASLGIEPDSFVALYTAEFTPTKNHSFLIEATDHLAKIIPNFMLLLAGEGVLCEKMKKRVKEKGLCPHVRFLGFRTDIEKFAQITDVGVSTSTREGLGIGLLEQMSCEVPIVASENKGHLEFVQQGVSGLLFEQGDLGAFISSLVALYEDPEMRRRLGRAGATEASRFSVSSSLSAMQAIYRQYIPSKGLVSNVQS